MMLDSTESEDTILPTRAWPLFWTDLRWSVRAWASGLWFVMLVVALQAALVAVPPRLDLLDIPLLLGLVGFVGTERIFYLRAYRNSRLEAREVVPFSWRFIGRFLVLGIVAVVPFVAIIATIEVVVQPAPYKADAFPIWVRMSILTFGLILDLLLTFVTPALAFSTRSVNEALHIGWRMLKDTWPTSAWYAFTPGLTLGVIALVLPRSLIGLVGSIALAGVTGALGFAFKGAVVPFYVRHAPGIGKDGTVN